MNYPKVLIALSFSILVLSASIAAQTPHRTTQAQGRTAPKNPSRPATTARPASGNASTNPSNTTATAAPAGALAVVNGQAIMPAEIEEDVRAIIAAQQDPYLQAFYEDERKEMAAARSRGLDARIKSLLLEAEARRRKITVEQLIENEIDSRIPAPTEEEIRAVYDANRAQLGNADLESVRSQIVGYLRGKNSERLYGELSTRLRMSHTVTKGADVNAPNLAPGTVLVTVADRQFTAGMLDERLKSYFYKLRYTIYRAQQQALDKRINDMLLVAEAQRRGVTPESLVQQEITGKMHPVTDADAEKFYKENKERIPGDFASAREVIVNYLQQQEQERVERDLANKLRASANLSVLLKEPDAPVQAISVDDDPARGDARSPVTIVEFTDFQCPACGAMYPVLEEVLKSYGTRVRFVVRDFPLAQHKFARKAAEAADAANAQGKFFEYINLLFTHQDALDVDSLKRYASQLNLDRAKFDAALDRGTYAAEVQHDVDDGELYGVGSTPSIFINGVLLQDLSAEGLRAAIDKAFARAGIPSPARAAAAGAR